MLSGVVMVVVAQLFAAVRGAQLRATSLSASVDAEGFFSYDYSQHGQDWVMGSCASRSRQSPVNFMEALLQNEVGRFSFLYELVTTPFELINNGHTYSADLAGFGYGGITHNGAWYNLLNINVHAQSEHQWGGRNFPLEIHLVHKRFDSDHLLIVAVPVTCAAPPLPTPSVAGFNFQQMKQPFPSPTYIPPQVMESNFNPALQAFLKAVLPPVKMKQVAPVDLISPLDINAFLEAGTYMEYGGSMTAPPCAELATWLVRREPILASNTQVFYLHDGIYKMTGEFGNDRAVMPLNGRQVRVLNAMKESRPIPTPPGIPTGGPQADKEYKAARWAKDALKISKSSTAYIRDLDRRLRSAAMANADALSRPRPMSISGMFATTPSPATTISPLSLENTAASMSAAIAEGAKEAIGIAVQEIAEQANAAAMAVAKKATESVVKAAAGQMVPLPVPTVPPAAAFPVYR